jgi:large subunit ribosomal protein L24
MAKLHIRKGDRVKVVRGNHAGQEGTVLRVDREKRRVVVEGINMRKRHRKPTAMDPEGGITTFEAPVDASNVMLIDPASGEPTRTRGQTAKDGTKERVAVKSGKVVPRA